MKLEKQNIDLVGKKFGKWTVINLKNEKIHYELGWECLCDCGKIKNVRTSYLINGRSKSCGCNRRNHISHVMTNTRQYKIWSNMHSRCNNPNVKSFSDYGAKGIKICKEWDSFENFWEDMKLGYNENLTLERKNNYLGYNPNNCIWVTKDSQARNKTSNIVIEYEGSKYCLAELCRKLSLNYYTIYQRIKILKWEPLKAINF